MMTRQQRYRQFFEKVVEYLKRRRPGVVWRILEHPPGYNWVAVDRVKGKIWYGVGFTRDGKLRVALHIKLGNQQNTKMLYDELLKRNAIIKKALGLEVDSLEWASPAKLGAKAGRIAIYYGKRATIDDSPEHLQELREWGVDMIISLRTVLTSHLDELLGQSSVFGSGK